MAYVDELLGQNEERLHVAHPHWTVLVEWIALRVLGMIVLAVAIGVVAARTHGTTRQIIEAIIGVVFLVLLVQAVLQFLRWKNELYVITDRRVIQLYGLFGKHTKDSSLNMINDLILDQSVFGRMLDYGDLSIVTGNDVGEDTLKRVDNPLGFKRAVLAARDTYLQHLSGADNRPATYAPTAPTEDVTALIARLADLHKRGAISRAEYDAKRAELLRRI